MTLEELKAFMNDPANKQAFDEIVRAMGYETQDEIANLKRNNKLLLDEKQKIKQKFEENQKVLDSIDVDEYNALREKHKGKDPSSDELAKFQREQKKLLDALEKEKADKDNLQNRFYKSLIEKQISDALDSQGFDSRHKTILQSAFQGKAKVEIDGDKELVVIETGDGLALPSHDYFKQFASTDQGKTYLRQPENKGSGSGGFSQSGGKRTMTRAQFDQLAPLEKAAALKDAQLIDN